MRTSQSWILPLVGRRFALDGKGLFAALLALARCREPGWSRITADSSRSSTGRSSKQRHASAIEPRRSSSRMWLAGKVR